MYFVGLIFFVYSLNDGVTMPPSGNYRRVMCTQRLAITESAATQGAVFYCTHLVTCITGCRPISNGLNLIQVRMPVITILLFWRERNKALPVEGRIYGVRLLIGASFKSLHVVQSNILCHFHTNIF